jgi:non-ribosomal peptide synthetase-like protein
MLVCKDADNAIRWKVGERLDHLFEQRCDALSAQGAGDHAAVLSDGLTLSFAELDARANQAARHLLARGLTAGDRIGLMFDKQVETYVALLAVLKINAAYVPLDAGFPPDRIAFILQDAGVRAIVSLSDYADTLSTFEVPKVYLDRDAQAIARASGERLSAEERPPPRDELCYVIYTSGTTGKPKGVAISHASICNFVRVAGEVYGIQQGDRSYQGMTIAFDFSVEELWLPLLKGATLVPGKPGANLVGDGLAQYLRAHKVTYFACVPTLLATIETDLPDLRILLVSGEACPQNLVARWHRPGLTILNAYGPTEATVTATLTRLYPEKPVTIGVPLPTYTIVILDESADVEVADGALGEICIAGVGLADGYLNRPELTAQKFIPDCIGLPENPSGRIYRTGDVGRINADGEVEFLGRIDTQVKLRGYRIELGEIEAVLAKLPQIAQAVVHTHESEPGTTELVAYYTLKQNAQALPLDEAAQVLKAHLPRYMIPAYFERLDAIPMTGSHKADRKALPAPSGPRFAATSGAYVAPRSETEALLSERLCAVMSLERVSVTDNFFHDLGAHSLLMARFCSQLRRGGTDVAIKDIYLNPTIEALARFLGTAAAEESAPPQRLPLRVPSNLEYYGCGALQLLAYALYGSLIVWVVVAGIEWSYERIDDAIATYLRVAAVSFALFVLMSALPIAAKWLLIGRWQETVIPVWSLAYFRFWLVKMLTRTAPVAALRGTPAYNLYLRLLGAQIGAGSVIRCRFLPVCTDLISIGSNTVLREDCLVQGYRAQANHIYTGPIAIGDDAIVGEASVLDIDTAMGNGAQLAHASSLHCGQCIPDGKRWHGSPAQETTADYSYVRPRECSPLRRALYSVFQIAGGILLASALPVALIYALPALHNSIAGAPLSDALSSGFAALALEVLTVAVAFSALAFIAGLALVAIVPRLLHAFIAPDKTYPLYGFHYWVFRAIAFVSNSATFNLTFGDSALIVPYQRLAGYELNEVVQTGSNFGLVQKHDDPLLCDIGSGTMVSDGLMMINGAVSASSFALRRVEIGDHTYVGNNVVYPAAAKTGSNCLLATKVMVPVEGPERTDTGLLGSPPFEIPRVVDRDRHLQVRDPALRRRLVAAKTRYNVVTILGHLACMWLLFAVAAYLVTLGGLYHASYGTAAVIAAVGAAGVASILGFALMERASLGFGRLRPQVVSMYDRGFWRHERYWKFSGTPLGALLKGTPMRNLLSRLTGVRLGRMVFDDGGLLFDRTLLDIGDYTNLNEYATFSAHSLEEGVFKSDHIRTGSGCTIGCGAFVHYGTTLGDGAVIEPDSFLMKGETAEDGSTWRGNPARAIRVSGMRTSHIEVALPEPALTRKAHS